MRDVSGAGTIRWSACHKLTGLLFALAMPLCVADTVTIVTSDYPPYHGPSLPRKGVETAILIAAFERAGDKVVMRYRPWARALEEAKLGLADGMLGPYYSAERAAYFAYSEPVFANAIGFYGRRGQPVDVRKLASLKNLKIGVVHGYRNPDAFTAANLTVDEAPDDETNLVKLAAKRVDLILIDKGVGDYLLKHRLNTLKDQLVWLEPAVETIPAYVVFSRRVVGWERRLAHFNAGLDALRADGTLQRLSQHWLDD